MRIGAEFIYGGGTNYSGFFVPIFPEEGRIFSAKVIVDGADEPVAEKGKSIILSTVDPKLMDRARRKGSVSSAVIECFLESCDFFDGSQSLTANLAKGVEGKLITADRSMLRASPVVGRFVELFTVN